MWSRELDGKFYKSHANQNQIAATNSRGHHYNPFSIQWVTFAVPLGAFSVCIHTIQPHTNSSTVCVMYARGVFEAVQDMEAL